MIMSIDLSLSTGFFDPYEVLSDQDIDDIVDILTPNEIKHVYKELHFTAAEKEEAIKENLDPREEGRIVLRYWREINGSKATRQKILDALRTCKLKYKAFILEKMWAIPYAATGAHDTCQRMKWHHKMHDYSQSIDVSLSTGLYKYVLSDQDIDNIVDILKPNEIRRLYKGLNVSPIVKEAAVKENLDPKEEARLVLTHFRQMHGKEATREQILKALRANKLTQYAAYKLEQRWNIQYAPQGDGNVNSHASATHSQDGPRKKRPHSQDGPRKKRQKCSAKSDL